MRILKCYWFLWLFVVTTLAGLGLGSRFTLKAEALKRDANGRSQVYSGLNPETLVASVVKFVRLGQKEVLVSARTIGSEHVLTALVEVSQRAQVKLLLDRKENPADRGVVAWLKRSKFRGEIRWASAGLFEQRLLIDGKIALSGAQPWSPRYASSDATIAFSGDAEVAKWCDAFTAAWKAATPVGTSQ